METIETLGKDDVSPPVTSGIAARAVTRGVLLTETPRRSTQRCHVIERDPARPGCPRLRRAGPTRVLPCVGAAGSSPLRSRAPPGPPPQRSPRGRALLGPSHECRGLERCCCRQTGEEPLPRSTANHVTAPRDPGPTAAREGRRDHVSAALRRPGGAAWRRRAVGARRAGGGGGREGRRRRKAESRC